MKRGQIEKINAALLALLDAVPDAASITVRRDSSHGARIALHVETDDAIKRLATSVNLRLETTTSSTNPSEWWFDASGPVEDVYLMIVGPSHFDRAAPAGDERIEAAIAQADAASAVEQTSLLCYADTDYGPCIEANGHDGEHRSSATTDDPIEQQMRAAVVFDSKGVIVKDRRGALPTRGDS